MVDRNHKLQEDEIDDQAKILKLQRDLIVTRDKELEAVKTTV